MFVYKVTSPGGRTTKVVAKNSVTAKKALKFWGLSTEFIKDCSAKKL